MALSFGDLYRNKEENWTRTWQITRLILLVREPTSLFAYWEIDDNRKKILSDHFRQEWAGLPLFIKLHDVTDIIFDGNNAHSTRTNQVHPNSDNWYFHNVQPGRHYIVEISALTSSNSFLTILRSNTVGTPPKYFESNLESKIRFSKPSLQDTKKQGEFSKYPISLPGKWRDRFTGYNLVKIEKGGE